MLASVMQIWRMAPASPATSLKVQIQMPLRRPNVGMSLGITSSNQIAEQVIHPYYLKQYNNRWFLFGKNPEYEGIRNLALDRIEDEITETNTDYILNTEYNFDEYFEDIIGVTKSGGKQIEKVKLWFSPAQAPYIHTKPLHGTQKEKWDESGLTLTVEVIPNVELEQLILRYGENCQVLEPKQLRTRIQERLNEAAQNYKSSI